MVKVCVICLATEGKLSWLRGHKLATAYQQLLGYPARDEGGLQQALCARCSQRLKHFTRLREQSLRARFVMRELVQGLDSVTTRHIQEARRESLDLMATTQDTCVEIVHCTSSDDEMEPLLYEDDSDASNTVQSRHSVHMEPAAGDLEPAAVVIDLAGEDLALAYVDLRPAVEDFEPAYEALGPAAEDIQPAYEILGPAAEDIQPAYEILGQAAEDVQPEYEVLGPAAEDIKPAYEILRPAAEDVQPEYEVLGPAAEDIIPAYEILRPAAEDVQPEYEILGPAAEDIQPAYDDLGSASEDLEWESEDLEPAPADQAPALELWYNNGLLHHQHSMRTASTSLSATPQRTEQAPVTHSGASHDRAADNYSTTYMSSCVVVLCDIYKPSNVARKRHASLTRTRAVCSCGSMNTACEAAQYRTASESEVAATRDAPAVSSRFDTEPSGEKRYTCSICNNKCTDCRYSNKHHNNHSAQTRHACKICCYKCDRKHRLLEHMKIHTGEKPYVCKKCGHKFTTKANLVTHMRIHTGEKPFACKQCSYKSTQRNNLYRHIRFMHTTKKS